MTGFAANFMWVLQQMGCIHIPMDEMSQPE
jgi:hypothetical protein